MPAIETFSKRQKRLASADQAEVYQYDLIPEAFRIQVIYIWIGAIGRYRDLSLLATEIPPANRFCREIHDGLARELGVLNLGHSNDNPFEQCKQFLLSADVNRALDIIEWTFHWMEFIHHRLNPFERRKAGINQSADEAIEELNHRFREHGIGYQYVSPELVRVDSQYTHAEVVKPAISLLQEAGFRGASDEFVCAHEHYRHGRNKEAIAEALKAFESTLKTICDARKWAYSEGATARQLIGVVLDNELVPKSLASHFSALRSVMEAGLPTVRNKMAGHGQGSAPVDIPPYFAAYALHLAASNIVLLVEAHKAMK